MNNCKAEEAKRYFEAHPNVDCFHVTKDGQFFKTQHEALNQNELLKRRKKSGPIEKVTREAVSAEQAGAAVVAEVEPTAVAEEQPAVAAEAEPAVAEVEPKAVAEVEPAPNKLGGKGSKKAKPKGAEAAE